MTLVETTQQYAPVARAFKELSASLCQFHNHSLPYPIKESQSVWLAASLSRIANRTSLGS